MKTTIAIGVLALALVHHDAAAQTAGEQAQILRDFEASVAATPAPKKIFTLPVAMVFRQLIAKALAERDGVVAVSGVSRHAHPVIAEPFPSTWLQEFPRVLQDALPPLPPHLEYRLVGHDLVIRNTEGDVVAGVLRDAVGPALAVIH